MAEVFPVCLYLRVMIVIIQLALSIVIFFTSDKPIAPVLCVIIMTCSAHCDALEIHCIHNNSTN